MPNELARFDTPAYVAEALLRLTGAGRSVLDLASGGGALAAAALASDPDCQIVTVDVDPLAVPSLGADHRHILADVLAGEFPLFPGQFFDLVLCNPPYGEEREIHFVTRALNQVKPEGRAGFVLPHSFLAGVAAADVRRSLAAEHHIANIVSLPRGTFPGADVSAFLLTLQKGLGPSLEAPLHVLDRNGELSEQGTVDLRSQRWDRQSRQLPDQAITLRQLGAEVVRGRLKKGEEPPAGSIGVDTPDLIPDVSWIHLTGHGEAPDGAAVEGDILVARIGRNLHRKVSMVLGGWAIPSDSILRIRLPDEDRGRAFLSLSSEAGRQSLALAARGTGAMYLTREDLLDLPLT